MLSVFGVLFLGWISIAGCVPVSEENPRSVDTGFIGRGTRELATALLQGYVQKEENMAYSPFGYSAILAVFAEGARGQSREEIANALHFPADAEAVRRAFRSVLERFVGKKFSNSPEFKNWFYIYRNYTVEEELQNVLRKYYLTEVKCVERPEDYIKDTKKSPIRESMDPDQKIAMELEKIPEEPTPMSAPMDTQKSEQPNPMSAPMEGQKNEQQNSMPAAKENQKSEESDPKPVSAQVQHAEQPAVNTVQKEEMMKADVPPPTSEELKAKLEKSAQTGEEENKVAENSKYKGEEEIGKSEVMKEERTAVEMEKSEKETPTMAPVKTDVEMGLMPVEHFSGMTDSSLRIKGEGSKPRMVIFNGLYYKGEWESPFVKKPADDSRVFYKSDKEKIFVATIHSQGVFNYGNVPNLDARAIELPYRGGRYSLLVLVPNTRNGLSKLISDLSGYPFEKIYDQLSEKLVDVCLPSFEINTIAKPISSLHKLGMNKVNSIFNPETADLSGISSKDSGLFVEELVQMVTFKVDANYSKANLLTASIASSRSNSQTFQINHPFLFYLRDNLEDIIIVNGKVIDPTPKPNFYFS